MKRKNIRGIRTSKRNRSKAPKKPREKTIHLTLSKFEWSDCAVCLHYMQTNQRASNINSYLRTVDPGGILFNRAANIVSTARKQTRKTHSAEETKAVFAIIVNAVYFYPDPLQFITKESFGNICTALIIS